jgi:DNA repair photolyase
MAVRGRVASFMPAVRIEPPRKGRGAGDNLPHRFTTTERTADGDALDAQQREGEMLPPLATEVTVETARSILSYNDSPDLGFDRAINPHRGCEHGCVYCYARPTHSYLNLSPGLDFETQLVAKLNAAELLRRELAARSYAPQTIVLGAATDAYQPVERDLRITRQIVEVLAQTRHPLSIVTKANLVERDLDLLAPMAADGLVAVAVSITTLDHELSRKLEPRAASPQRRLRTVETLARAGVPTVVNFAPVIPFINEPELEQVLTAARTAGAVGGFYTVLRLPWEVSPLFQQWLADHYPLRAERVMNRVRDMRGGRDYDADFKTRMNGEGPWAALIRTRFDKACARLGLSRKAPELRRDLFRPPAAPTAQLSLL